MKLHNTYIDNKKVQKQKMKKKGLSENVKKKKRSFLEKEK